MVDKKFLFKLEIKNSATSQYGTPKYGPSYRVKRICSDPAIIERFINASVGNSVGAQLRYCCYCLFHNASHDIYHFGIKVVPANSDLQSTPSLGKHSAELSKVKDLNN